jgi:uncharacterized protein YdhG (YjbR/CyaY superfamily)
MNTKFENYFLDKQEPTKSCLLTLRDIILAQNRNIKACWKYRMPFFCINHKMLCYLWIDKQTNHPYIGFVDGNLIEHPKLKQGHRTRMKILPIHPNKDIPITTIETLLEIALVLKK